MEKEFEFTCPDCENKNPEKFGLCKCGRIICTICGYNEHYTQKTSESTPHSK